MKITDVRVRMFAFDLDEPVFASFGCITKRQSAIVEITTNEGITGIGETWVNFPQWAASERPAAIEEGLKPILVGEDPTNINKLTGKMHAAFRGVTRQCGALGPIYQAISGVDVALWDIWGKYLNQPIYQLLGGTVESSIKVYASGLGPDKIEPPVTHALESGIQFFKLKVGFGLEKDISNLELLRNLIGPDNKIMLDANQAWDLRTARKHLSRFEQYDIEFIEEPFPADDIESYAQLRKESSIPVAGGENLYGRGQFRRVLEKEGLDIVQPDVTKCGGISETVAICTLASAWNIPYALHMFGNAVGIYSSLHIVASISGGLQQEIDITPNPLRDQMLNDPIRICKGCIKLSDAPGLGIELNESVLEQYQIGN